MVKHLTYKESSPAKKTCSVIELRLILILNLKQISEYGA